MTYSTVLAYSYWASFHDAYIYLRQATTDTDYSCHIKATQLIKPIIWGLYPTTSRH